MPKNLSKITAEKFIKGINKKNPHNGLKVRFNWIRRKGGQ